MKIALINGSPKVQNSTSGILLEDLKGCLSNHTALFETALCTCSVSGRQQAGLASADAWVFACPLYVDSLPAHLLSCLMQMETSVPQTGPSMIYGIVNCGFYEGIQAEYALEIFQNWCARTGFRWGGGIGVGGGGGLSRMPDGPKKPIKKSIQSLSEKILLKETQENRYVSVAFPRFLYKLAAQMEWRQAIRANGGKPSDLGNRPVL